MLDVVERLRSYPDDPCAVMTRALVNEAADEIARLRAELAAERERVHDLQQDVEDAWHQRNVEAEQSAKLREALERAQKALARSQDWIDADEAMQTDFPDEWSVVASANKEALAAIDAVLNETGG